MNYEVDNTKYAKVIIIEAGDNKTETTKECTDLTCEYLDKGWKVLEALGMRPNYKVVLYWPEYKSNR